MNYSFEDFGDRHSQREQRDRQGVKKGLTLQLRAGVVSC